MSVTSRHNSASPWRKGLSVASPKTIAALRAKKLPKGDVFTVAKVAAIQAAKRTDELIPLCHSLPLDAVELSFLPKKNLVRIVAEARTTAKTGVEMEALTAVSVAALTIYDMCKAVDKTMVIEGVRLVSKIKNENRTCHLERPRERRDLRGP